MKDKIKEVDKRTDQLMRQFQEELLRKKNSIIENLQSTEKSLLDKVITNPRFWETKCFKFILNSQKKIVFDADINVHDRAERAERADKRELEVEGVNLAARLLYGISIFRQSVNRISGHYRCLREYCVYCHVKALFSDIEYSSGYCLDPLRAVRGPSVA